jgi:hypothetical protein
LVTDRAVAGKLPVSACARVWAELTSQKMGKTEDLRM